MSDFNKDEYLNDLPDMDNLSGRAAPTAGASQEAQHNGDAAAVASTHLTLPTNRGLVCRA